MPAIWSQVEGYKGNFLEGKTKPGRIVAGLGSEALLDWVRSCGHFFTQKLIKPSLIQERNSTRMVLPADIGSCHGCIQTVFAKMTLHMHVHTN